MVKQFLNVFLYKLSILLYRGNQKQHDAKKQRNTKRWKSEWTPLISKLILLFLETKYKSYLLKSEYGTNQLFKYWMDNNFNIFFRLAEENLKMPVWRYNDKRYLN